MACGALPILGQTQSVSEDYRIAPLDLLHFQIFEESDTALAQRVSASGELPLPMIGVVKVAGLTLREAEVILENRYVEEGFFVRPQVILVLQQYSDRYVSILGQIKTPSQIPFKPETNTIGLLEAITRAGGFTRIANTNAIQITRRGTDGVEVRLTVDVAEFLKARSADPKVFQLLPGDIVFVPERAF